MDHIGELSMHIRNLSLILCSVSLSWSLSARPAAAQNNPEVGDVDRHTVVVAPAPVVSSDRHDRRVVEEHRVFERTVAVSGTDHAAMVGHFGVGAFGVLELPTMGGTVGAGGLAFDNTSTLAAPTIGARYWLDERMAIEGALGIGLRSGSSSTTTDGGASVQVNDPSLFGLALHAGLPLVFATGEHFAFELVPELNIGFVTGSWDDRSTANRDTDLSGFLLELGARVGAEIQFGFIGIPQLALEGTVGLHLRYEGRSASFANTEVSSHRLTFGTSLQGEPWDIFTGNIAAIYYF
jgi:hypothetical protein